MKKYKLTKESYKIGDKTLYRIKALIDFNNIKKGDLGGFIESESNLSHDGDCWVYDNARVFGDARVFGNAKVYDNAEVSYNAQVYGDARVFGNVKVSDDARVFGNVKVYDDGLVYGNAQVYGDVKVYGNARVFNNAQVYGNAEVFGNARVFGYAQVFGNAEVFGDARVFGDAEVFGYAKISQKQYISYGLVTKDLSIDLIANIEAQTGLKTIRNFVYCYKHVREDLSSLHDSGFKYQIGEYAIAIDPEESIRSCASGLHVSNAQYWNGRGGSKILFCKVHLDDIITIQDGKIRCRKLFVIDECDGDTY